MGSGTPPRNTPSASVGSKTVESFAAGADEDLDVRRPDGVGWHRVPLGRRAAEDRPGDAHGVGHAGVGLLAIEAHRAERQAAAGAQAEHDPARRQLGQRAEGRCRGRGVAQVRVRHGHAEPDPGRAGRRRGEGHERVARRALRRPATPRRGRRSPLRRSRPPARRRRGRGTATGRIRGDRLAARTARSAGTVPATRTWRASLRVDHDGPVRLGLSPFASSRAGVEALAGLGVDGGIDTLWLGDGLLHNPDFPTWSGAMEPFTELAWLAGRFPTARLGLSAAVLPLRDVTWLAKQAMTLDHVSDGRFVLAVAPGFWAGRVRRPRLRARGAGRPLRRRPRRLGGRVRRPGPRRGVRARAGDPGARPVDGGWSAHLAGRSPSRPWIARSTAACPSRRPASHRTTWRRWLVAGRDGGGGLLGVRIRIGLDRVASRADGVDWQALTGPADFLAAELARYADLRRGRRLAPAGPGRPLVPRHRRGVGRARGAGSRRRGPARLRAIDRSWHHEDLSAGRAWSAS